ncbi:MAG: cyclic nucleotide-binding domain-containing protein [Anaerolineae bacterium]
MALLLKKVLPWQLSPIQLICSQAFCIGAALILYISIANALFIENFGSDFLPLIFIIAAVTIPALSFGFNQLSKRLTIGKLIQTVLLATIALFFATWVLNLVLAWKWVSMAMMVSFFFVTSYLLKIQGMQASQFFDVREMKNQSAMILTASMAGVILFGLTIRLWSTILGNHIHLILLSTILLLGLYALASHTIEEYPDLFNKKRESQTALKKPAALLPLLRQPFIRHIFAYQFLSTLGTQLVLYVFLRQASTFFQQSPDNMMPFFANFLAIGQVAAVGSLILVVRPLLKRIGVSFGLMTNPVAVLTLIVALLITTPLFPNRISIIFWLATIAMAVDIVFSFSTTDPTLRTLYQIIPPAERTKVTAAIESISIPLAFGFAGLTLLPFSFYQPLNRIHILIYIILICILWLIAGWQTFKQYRQTLHERLNRRMLDEVDLSLDNAETFSRVEGLIGTGNPPLIRLALNLLKQDNHSTYHSRLKGLLNYRNEIILSDVLARIEEEQLPDLYLTMSKLFERHKSNRIKGRLLKTLSACYPEESSAFVQEYIDDPDPEIQKGSLVGLIKYGNGPAGVAAGMRLMKIQSDPDIKSQLFTAAILEDVGVPTFYEPIKEQLEHAEADVRNGALRAATKVINPLLMDGIIKNLEYQTSRSAAMDALLAHGEHLIPVAQDILSIKNHDVNRQAKSRITRVLGKLKTDDALDILYDNIGHPDIVVRSAVLNALRNSQYQAETDEEKAVIDEQILAELLDAVYLVAIQRDIGEGDAMGRLNTALQIELVNIRSRLFNLLSFIYDRSTIWVAHSHMGSYGKRERSIALETLDVMLTDKHQQQISAVIDSMAPPEQRIQALKRWITIPEPQEPQDRLRSLINSDQTHSWTQACAIYATVKAEFTQLAHDIENITMSDDALVQETAQWAAVQLTQQPDKTNETQSGESHMITIEKVAILKAASIFNDTPENVLASVAAIVKEVPLGANETFITQGDTTSQEMYLVVEGEVEAVIDGKPIITLGQGQTVGELGIFNQEARSADVRTLTPTLLFSIEREALNELMADRPEIAQGIIGALSRRIRDQGRLMSQSA